MQLKNVFKICGILVLVLLGLTGCSRQVTDKASLLKMEVKINLRGSFDLSKYRYYLIVSKGKSPVMPAVSPVESFPVPGSTYNESSPFGSISVNGLNFFYRTYFSSWTDYVVAGTFEGTKGLRLFRSNADGFAATTTQNLFYKFENGIRFDSNVNTNSQQLRFVLDVQALSHNSNQLYFTLATAVLENGYESGTLADTLRNQQPVVTKEAMSTPFGPFSEPEDASIPAAVDIVSWEVKLF